MDFGNAVLMGSDEEANAQLDADSSLINFRFADGSSILFRAVTSGCDRLAIRLIEAHAPGINEQSEGLTTLDSAISKDKVELVKRLLQAGANPNLGRPIFVAKSPRVTHGIEILKLLLEHKVDVNLVYALYGNKKKPVSAYDFCTDRPDFLEILVKAGAKPSKVILKDNPETQILQEE